MQLLAPQQKNVGRKAYSLLQRKGLVLWLLAIMIVYQMVYQVIMLRALQQQQASDEECGSGLTALGDGSSFANELSPLCMEVQLFKAWQQKAEQPRMEDGATAAPSGGVAATTPTVPGAGQQVTSLSKPEPPKELREHFAAQRRALLESHAKQEGELLAKLQSLPPAREAGDEGRDDVASAWRRDLQQLHRHLDSGDLDAAISDIRASDGGGVEPSTASSSTAPEKQGEEDVAREAHRLEFHRALEAKHVQEEKELKEHNDELNAGLAAIAKNHAAWEKSFEREVREAQRDLCSDTQHRQRPDCAKLLAEMAEEERKEVVAATPAEVAPPLPEVRDMDPSAKVDLKVWQQESVRVSHDAVPAGADGDLNPLLNNELMELSTDLERLVLQKVEQPQQQQEEERQEQQLRPSTAEEKTAVAAAPPAVLDAGETDAVSQRLTSAFSQTLAHTSALKDAKAAQVAVALKNIESPSALRGDRRHLRWGQQPTWTASSSSSSSSSTSPAAGGSGSRSVAVLGRHELEAARWMSAVTELPTVLCVTAVPTNVTKEEMWTFMNRFYLQSYEGHVHLALVHHHADQQAAMHARVYADGKRVVSVEAQGNQRFPSSVALRFGAWLAVGDAQLVAQWDFEVKHHPLRLKMQVRALAAASRPGCLLTTTAAQPAPAVQASSSSTSAGGDLQETTLVGETRWMRRFWLPMMKEQRQLLHSLEGEHLVQVDLGGPLPGDGR